MAQLAQFPNDWQTALVLVAHPDDPEYGMSAAVNRWTSEGKRVVYGLATSGEAGIQGMTPQECGPLREDEQRASAARVGVNEVEFWGFPDSELFNTPQLRAKITEAINRIAPDVVLSLFGGPEWAPGFPNQRDHMEFSAAVRDAASYERIAAVWASWAARMRASRSAATARSYIRWHSSVRGSSWPLLFLAMSRSDCSTASLSSLASISIWSSRQRIVTVCVSRRSAASAISSGLHGW